MRAQAVSDPLQPLSFLAFDFGTRRIGVASGNSLTRSAAPLGTIAAQGEARFEAIGRLIAEWQPAALVVGVPLHPDGAAHVNTARARRFGRQLQARFGLPVHEVDERYTTTEARRAGRRRPRRRRGGDHPRAVPGRAADEPPCDLDAEALYAELLAGVRGLLKPDGVLVGIWSGGAWLAERLQRDLGLAGRTRRDLERAASRRLLAARPVGRRRPHPAAVRDRGPPHRPRRRRALHRPDDPRRRQRALRFRPAGERRAGRAGRPRRPRAADRGGLRGREDRAAGDAAALAGPRRRRPLQLRDP